MNKKILSLVLVLSLVLGSFSFAFAATPTSDVAGTNVEDAVSRLGKLEILKGYPDGTFKPNNTITRAEFATAVARARGYEAAAQNAKGDTPFTDVTGSHWASGYVNISSKAGLVNGMGNGIFAPEAQITYEQAVTLVVRALGYEAAANANGGYPHGHLAIASAEGLLDDVKGVQGSPATRGLVAQLLDNALDIPKMIQVGYGDQTKWVKSGTENTNELYLFDDLGLERLEKATIESADQSKALIRVRGLDKSEKSKTKTLNVEKDFNFAAYEGLKATVWFDKNDNLIDVKLDNDFTVKFDAIEVTKNSKSDKEPLGGEIKLLTEDKKYDVTDEKYDATFTNKNDVDLSEDEKYNFAKIILDEHNDITWVEAYDLDEMIVVQKIDGDTIKGYDGKELEDLNDYSIIKDGKQILVSDLDDKDVVIYNDDDEYAAVLTVSKEGKIERIYDKQQGFKLDGKTYDLDSDYGIAKYISGEDLEEVDEDVLEEMQDSGDIKVVLSFNKDVVFIDGAVEEVASNYAMVEADTTLLTGGRDKQWSLDVLNSEGKLVKYDVDEKDINDGDIIVDKGNFATYLDAWKDAVKEGKVIELKLNASSEVKEIIASEGSVDFDTEIELDDTFAKGKKLKSNTLVFWADGETDIEDYTVLKWNAIKNEFTKIQNGTVFYNEDDEVIAIYASQTDNDEEGKEYVAVITKVKELSSKENRYDVEFEINGKEYKGYTAKGAEFKTLKADQIKVLRIAQDSKEVKSVSNATTESVTIKSATASKLTVEGSTKEYKLEGIYYDSKLDSAKAKDAEGKKAVLYFEPGSTTYVQVVVIGGKAGTNEDILTGSGVITYKNGSAFEIDNKTIYNITANTVLKDTTGTIALGLEVSDELEQGDQVKVDGNTITIVAKAADRAEALAIKVAQDAVTKAESTKVAADLNLAQTKVDLLSAGKVKTDLQARLDAIQTVVAVETAKATFETSVKAIKTINVNNSKVADVSLNGKAITITATQPNLVVSSIKSAIVNSLNEQLTNAGLTDIVGIDGIPTIEDGVTTLADLSGKTITVKMKATVGGTTFTETYTVTIK